MLFKLFVFIAILFFVKADVYDIFAPVDSLVSDGIPVPYNGTEIESSTSWTMYKQCDSRWGSNKLGTCSQTICSAGCAMSSVAMMLKTKGKIHFYNYFSCY